MPKQIRYNGVVQNFPDDATDDEIRSALEAQDRRGAAQPSIPSTKPATFAEAAQNPTYAAALGVTPGALLERMKGVGQSVGRTGMTGLQWLQSAAGYQPTPTPSFLEARNPEQQIGQQVGELTQFGMLPAEGPAAVGRALQRFPYVARAAQTGLASLTGGLGGSLISAAHGEDPTLAGVVGAAMPLAARVQIPTTARAKTMFEAFEPKIPEQPMTDLGRAKQAVAGAQEVAQYGGGGKLPDVLADFVRNREAAGFGPLEQPLPYKAGRLFASQAGELSAAERGALKGPMRAKVADFAQAMDEASRNAAIQAGHGPEYDAAMRIYRQAQGLKNIGTLAKKYGPPLVLGSYMSRGLLRDLMQQGPRPARTIGEILGQ